MKKIIDTLKSAKLAFVFCLGFGIVLGVSGLALGQSVVDNGKVVSSQCGEVLVPASKLPAEWVWRTNKVNFDHMYRNAR